MGFFRTVTRIMNCPVRVNLRYRFTAGTASIIVLLFVAVCGSTAYYLTYLRVDFQGDFARKIAFLENSGARLSLDRNTVDLALAYYLKGETKQAERLFTSILEANQHNGLANIYLGLIFADQGKYLSAIPYLEKGIQTAPMEEPLAFGYLGLCYYRVGNNEKAIRFLEMACQTEAESPVNYYYLGLLHSKQGDVSQARIDLKKALLLAGNNYPEASTALQQLKDNK